ncbi:MAG: hypothetical protein NC930_02890 [Candidatus Omnitrophica bacterium]|nr:hypothetical protein [Candidatus Omnitrophota bacterium]
MPSTKSIGRRIAVEKTGIKNPTAKDSLEQFLDECIKQFLATNGSARVVAEGLRVIGVGFRPLIDHIGFRALDVEDRVREFLRFGYTYDAQLGKVEYGGVWAKVYRKAGYPAIFISQPKDSKTSSRSPVSEWVRMFGTKPAHHLALRVEEIESSVYFLEKQGIVFSGKIIGDKGGNLRQRYTMPEIRNGQAFTVLEIIERNRGYGGFLASHENLLDQSSTGS